MPEISIITPAYIDSHEKLDYLEETIKSVLCQTFEDWEMIIINDKSDLIISFKDIADRRIKLYNMSEQSKPSLCRNVGVALAESECILPLDADDLLFDENTLQTMYNHWKQSKSKIVYGNMQRMEKGKLGRTYEFPEYTFERTLDLRGTIPVTGMFSKDCHFKAGGWKKEFTSGLEDIEFWISCGLAGFCGKHIDTTTLIYRKHDTSRTHSMRIQNEMGLMRNKIRIMHQSVYEGDRPMGCCGGGRVANEGMQANNNITSAPTRLEQFSDNEKIWVEYQGGRDASWGVVGKFTGISYQIMGKGHKIQIHEKDALIFKASGRGRDFNIDVNPPEEYVSEEKQPGEYTAPNPELAMIDTRIPVTFGVQ